LDANTTGWLLGGAIRHLDAAFQPFFYNQVVSPRAGTILHASRHAGGNGYDSGNKDSSWEYNGAWRWQVRWLAWFACGGTRTSTAMKNQARQRADNLVNSNIDVHPGLNVRPARPPGGSSFPRASSRRRGVRAVHQGAT
jgi:hypothetical protein